MHINFAGPLNNLQVKNHDLAMYVVSSWTATMNKTESTQGLFTWRWGTPGR